MMGEKKKVLIKIERKMLGYFVRVHSNAGISPLAAPKPGQMKQPVAGAALSSLLSLIHTQRDSGMKLASINIFFFSVNGTVCPAEWKIPLPEKMVSRDHL